MLYTIDGPSKPTAEEPLQHIFGSLVTLEEKLSDSARNSVLRYLILEISEVVIVIHPFAQEQLEFFRVGEIRYDASIRGARGSLRVNGKSVCLGELFCSAP